MSGFGAREVFGAKDKAEEGDVENLQMLMVVRKKPILSAALKSEPED